MKIKNFTEAKKYLLQHVPVNPLTAFPGGHGLSRTKYLLGLLGNPQNKIKIIHIAGTSGKSSTSYILSLLLRTSGWRTGLYISPHISDIRERIRINNKLIEKSKFVKYLNLILPHISAAEKSKFGTPTYFEILTILAFYSFAAEQIDYAVIETGLGGLLDATNCVSREDKINIITKLGLDHTEILGNTLNKIAAQKAGIINKKNMTISAFQDPSAQKVLQNSSDQKKGKLFFIRQKINFNIMPDGKKFNFHFLKTRLNSLSLGLLGDFQIENASLALSALVLLAERDNFTTKDELVHNSLKKANFTGRFSKYLKHGKTLIFDGAHNEQKMNAFLNSLKKTYPGKKFNFLIAFKNTKNFEPMLDLIVILADSITITTFTSRDQDWHHKSTSPHLISEYLKKIKFKKFEIIDDSSTALNSLLKSKNKNAIIITGSFYLINELRLKKHL